MSIILFSENKEILFVKSTSTDEYIPTNLNIRLKILRIVLLGRKSLKF